ncbi:beta-fructofuranosidase, insoluble isoenzyme CWINV1-like [Diospyros lotus]|uniref:beta-fructofuranosidase, insoluble isoenzyme CWINV1-like n=1 Tax=Diospyros lotus TaxID=55363 RepID=UPI00224E2EE6|nr:beta-fructofuranosidase, insoluble isoenzyme CWINV1-like [Diospyros lotus]
MAAAASSSRLLFYFIVLVIVSHGVLQIEASHVFYGNLESLQPTNPNPTYRTSYHFQPPKNWMNDPNGPMIYKGIYHFFYQYNPYGADWGNIVWAHSTSLDLVNWKSHPPAIKPSVRGDINGCWSGSATLLPGNKPAMLYTGIDPQNRQVQNLAMPSNLSDPYLVKWSKFPSNPVMEPTITNQINSSSFRDPTTAWLGHDGRWRTVVGSKRNRRGLAILYRSKDFVRWTEARHPLHSAKDTGMWECPDFYPVSTRTRTGLDTSRVGRGIKHVMKLSLDDTKHDYYTVGTYDLAKDKYVPDKGSVDNDSGLRYDYGKFYASKTFYDSAKKRRILWGWINESLPLHDYVRQGWSGLQAIPRAVWLDKSGKQLVQWPISEIEKLRRSRVGLPAGKVLKAGSKLEVSSLPTAAQADVEVSFEVQELGNKAETMDPSWTNPQLLCSRKDASAKGGLGPFGLKVLASKNDSMEYTAIFFRIYKLGLTNKYKVLMCSDQSRSSLNTSPDKTTYGAFVEVDPAREKLSLRTLIDHSIVESFGGGGKACITARVYPTLAIGEAAHLYVFNHGNAHVRISSFSAWSMKKAHLN